VNKEKKVDRRKEYYERRGKRGGTLYFTALPWDSQRREKNKKGKKRREKESEETVRERYCHTGGVAVHFSENPGRNRR